MYKVTIIQIQSDHSLPFLKSFSGSSDNEQQIIINFDKMDQRLRTEGKIITRFATISKDGYSKTTITYYLNRDAYLERMTSNEMKELNKLLENQETNNQITYIEKFEQI